MYPKYQLLTFDYFYIRLQTLDYFDVRLFRLFKRSLNVYRTVPNQGVRLLVNLFLLVYVGKVMVKL